MPKAPDSPPLADEDDRTTSVGLYHFAESYRDCAMRLADEPPPDLIFTAPIEFLIWHAMELYLKAYLRSAGLGVAALRTRPYGHNLSRLHSECTRRGLVLTRYPEAFFDFMDPEEPMEARYIRTGSHLAKPTVDTLLIVAAEIREAVAQALKAKGEPIRWWNAGTS